MAQQTFDYIVVGAGTSGCVLAARLAQDPQTSVLLLEAGDSQEEKWQTRLPVGNMWCQEADTDWGFQTEEEAGCAGRKIRVHKGKLVGGSSSVNELLYVRGNAEDYENWFRGGVEDWQYEKVLPYFKKGENNLNIKDKFHGGDGEQVVRQNSVSSILIKQFIEAAEHTGHRHNSDYNGRHQDGFGMCYMTVDEEGIRSSVERAYLLPACNGPRNNLRRKFNCLADKVIFEKKTAIGVDTVRLGEQQTYYCNNEIILCAGAYNSPAILQRSGVGSRDLLENLKIPVVSNVAGVGNNLQDHLYVPYCLEVNPGFSDNAKHRKAADEIQQLKDSFDEKRAREIYEKNGLNPHFGPTPVTGFIRTKPLSQLQPDIQYVMLPLLMGGAWREGAGLSDTAAGEQVDFVCALLSPSSKGTVKIRSQDPNEAPEIRHNYLADKNDVETLKIAIEKMREIINQPSLDVARKQEALPGANCVELEEYIRQHCWTSSHPACSCKMGKPSDVNAVTSYRGQVRGVKGLRVADSSVMPMIISGNTSTAAVMIAEKMSDYIIEDNVPLDLEEE